MYEDYREHVAAETGELRRLEALRIPVTARLSDGAILHDRWPGRAVFEDDIEEYQADVLVYYNARVVEFEIGKPKGVKS